MDNKARLRTYKEKLVQQEKDEAWERLKNEPRYLDEWVQLPGQRRAQLLYATSFEPGYVWDIFETGISEGQAPAYAVYRSEIESGYPRYVLRGFQQLAVPNEPVHEYLTYLRSLTLPIAPIINGYTIADATFYELALFGDMNTAVRFCWSEASEEWTNLTDIVMRLLDLLLHAEEQHTND